MLLAVGAIRTISDKYDEDLFTDVMEANSFEEESGKVLIEFTVQPNVDEEDQWALDMSGFVAYSSSIDEFVEAFNTALEAADFPEKEEE